MTTRRQDGTWVNFFAEIRPELVKRLEQQAKKNLRSRTAELMVILDSVLPPLVEEPNEKQLAQPDPVKPAARKPRKKKET